MTQSTSNEGKCCDAVIRILEERHGAKRQIRSVDTPQSRGIEVRCTVGGADYAIEHTTLDPYPNRRLDDRQFLSALAPIQKELDHSDLLNADYSYHLYVDTHAFRNFRSREIPEVRDRIKNWVLAGIPKFDPPAPKHTQQLGARPPEVPVRVLLQCTWYPPMGRDFRIGRLRAKDLEPDRQERMREAIEKKGPKLQAEHNAGSRTILVMEDFDVALSNHIVIGQALRAVLPGAGFEIDEVYLVDTNSPELWHVFELKYGA